MFTQNLPSIASVADNAPRGTVVDNKLKIPLIAKVPKASQRLPHRSLEQI